MVDWISIVNREAGVRIRLLRALSMPVSGGIDAHIETEGQQTPPSKNAAADEGVFENVAPEADHV